MSQFTASKLHNFNPPMNGDLITFSDGHVLEVYQDGMDWTLTEPGTRYKGIICGIGHHRGMAEFIDAIIRFDRE